MRLIQIMDDRYNVAVINTDLFLYAVANKYLTENNLYVLRIYLANKDEPAEVKLEYGCFETLEIALNELYKE